MKLKKIMALLLVGCMAASLAACGSGEGKKNAKKGGDGPVEIDYATFMVGTHQSAEAEKKVIDEFNKKYEGKIKVNIEELPSDSAYVDKMKTLAASNALPDVVIGKEGIRELAVTHFILLQIRNRSSDIFIIRQCLKMQELSRQKPGTNLCPIMKS